MAQLYLSGADELNSELDLLLKDNLASMGDAVTQLPGTLAWAEAYAIANSQMAALNFIRLMSNQLTPTQLSVFARRMAAIFDLPATGNNLIPDNITYLQQTISLKEALFGTPNSFTNVFQYIKAVLGQIFIDLEFNPDIQNLASGNTSPPALPIGLNLLWFSPLSLMYARVWQPRDNQDHLLMPTITFLNTVDTYKSFVQEWIPAYGAVANMQLQYVGNDGYGINSSGVDGYASATNITAPYGSLNTINATAGTYIITGNGACLFTQDLYGVDGYGWHMPIEVVDDTNTLQTYHVTNVLNNNLLITQELILNNITARSYRLLGIQMDTPYALDGGMLFHE
jgi:hypothetical protein